MYAHSGMKRYCIIQFISHGQKVPLVRSRADQKTAHCADCTDMDSLDDGTFSSVRQNRFNYKTDFLKLNYLQMKKILLMAAASAILFSSCKKETIISEHEGEATISFDAKVGSADFALNQNTTIGTRTYNFKNLRYWVSNVSLVKADGSEVSIPDSYFLVEETNAVTVQDGAYTYPAKKREDVILKSIPVADYKQIKFSIGVDANHNDNLSIQSGELSQLSGMTNVSWMWHTSYIFTTLQGTVTEGATTKTFKAETGLNANYKAVILDLPKNVKISSTKTTNIALSLDIAKVLEGIDLIATPTVGASQAAVMATLANNYATKAITVVSAQ